MSSLVSALRLAHTALAGGWAAAWGHCDDRAVVERTPAHVLALVADATSPTYGGYCTPLGMDRGLAAIAGSLSSHDHVCGLSCLVAAFDSAHRAMRDLERAFAAEREAIRGISDPLQRSARAGGRIAERYGLRGDRLIHTASSVTACLFTGQEVHLAQIGSGRAYRQRAGRVELLLRDHTLNSELIAAGHEPMPDHRSVVTRVLGLPEEVQPEFRTLDVERGDRFLLCTDGVWFDNAALIEEAFGAPTARDTVDAIAARLKKPLPDDAALIAVHADDRS